MKIMEEIDKLYPLMAKDDLYRNAKSFKHELIAALHNQTSSLPTILNPIHKMRTETGLGVAVAIGGTNGYVSSFRVEKKGMITFLNRKIFSLPEQTTKGKLFKLISENICKVTNGRGEKFPIGIGFAYPLKPILHHGYIDGELLFMSKGRNIEGLVGKLVGQEYHKFLIKEYGMDTTVAVANDAICLLLGGNGAEVAGVVGTGLNFAYWEKRFNIAPLKLNELFGFGQGEVAINIEAKNFNKIDGTKLRETVDRKSDDPGYSLAEKETAGAYLYKIFNAGKDRLIGKDFPELTSTDQLNDIITGAYEYPRGIEISDKRKVISFAERIFHRSAQIVAIELCGILMKLGKTKGLVPVVMEGGIFWHARNYPALVNLYVNMILPEIIPSFARLFGSSRRGIAILARGI
ncbi:hypothetical protein A3D78_04365 [Candidatus Gottesmanbacteria bacterium RIFCSPHIGHO2_02_FULL_39_14]|uniref:Hexokinase n=1 Tax=Candidatus Gottesmanbacteria bacterium RIFCSPHIGHO2_02_FULL_39_14 TaxID=1798383 RepID=A0A1F6A3G6_9BACT|nr:MAG: hypothetical protein A3D78_04365 [Candidatus Gottesmanbacteria bacterium RIFCSPHIGHO2_02_FULL_39_14]